MKGLQLTCLIMLPPNELRESEGEVAAMPPESAIGHFESSQILKCLEGDEQAIAALYAQSIAFLSMIVYSTEKKNLMRWGKATMDECVHAMVAESLSYKRLQRLAFFDEPGAGYCELLRKTLRRRLIDQNRKWEGREAKHLSIDREEESCTKVVEAIEQGPTASDDVVSNEEVGILLNLMSTTLEPQDRELIILSSEKTPHEEIARRHDITPAAVATRLHRARRKLKAAYQRACEEKTIIS